MKITFDRAKWSRDSDGLWLSLRTTADCRRLVLSFITKLKDKLYTAELKEHKAQRSLNANAYMWVLLSKMAHVLNTDKDSLYLEALARYGVFTHVVVKPEIKERVISEWRTVRELSEVTINGKKGVQLQCYFGSSTYNTLEMAHLIDGIVSECRGLEIETLPPLELQRLKDEWGK